MVSAQAVGAPVPTIAATTIAKVLLPRIVYLPFFRPPDRDPGPADR
jgi:hypothetical protein